VIFIYFSAIISFIPRFYSWMKTTLVIPGVSIMTLCTSSFTISILLKLVLPYIKGGDDSDD